MQLQVLLSLGIDVHEEKCGNMESNEATTGGVESVHSIQFHVIITNNTCLGSWVTKISDHRVSDHRVYITCRAVNLSQLRPSHHPSNKLLS